MPQNIFKIYDGRTSFWQYDIGQKLVVLDNDITEVHFYNETVGTTRSRIVFTDGNGVRVCNVPNSLLQAPDQLIVYACTSDGKGTAKTTKSVKFAIIKRPVNDNAPELPGDEDDDYIHIFDGGTADGV